MNIDNEFEVGAPLDRVWPLLKDVRRVATCIPNAEITHVVDDATYKASVSVKVGPVNVNYRATVVVLSVDERAHRAEFRIDGQDKSGRGGIKATLTSSASERGGTTHVVMHTDAQISGIVATVGGRLIEGVAKQTVSTFAANLSAKVRNVPASA